MDNINNAASEWLDSLADSMNQLTGFRSHLRKFKHAFCQKPRLMQNHLVVFMQQGTIKVKVDDNKIELKAGDILWVPPGVSRVFTWQESSLPNIDYRLHFSLKRNEKHLLFNSKAEKCSNAWHLLPMFQILTNAYNSPIEFQEQHIRGTLSGLCAGYLSLPKGEALNSNRFTSLQKIHLDEFISRQIAEGVTPRSLSKELQLSHDYFTKRFKATYGESPRSYLKQYRVRVAASRLLASDLPVSEIAWQLGYNDANLFARQFRDVMNCSAVNYRKSREF